MKKYLLALMMLISLLAIGCGASATKPEDLRKNKFTEKSGTELSKYYGNLTANQTIPISEITKENNTYQDQNVNLVKIVTDVKIYDDYGKEVSIKLNKNASKEVFSVTVNKTANNVKIYYTYRAVNIPLEDSKTEVEIMHKHNEKINIDVYSGQTTASLYESSVTPPNNGNFEGYIKLPQSIILNDGWKTLTYENSLTPSSQGKFTTSPKIEQISENTPSHFVTFTLHDDDRPTYNTQLNIDVEYLYSTTEKVYLPTFAPIKEGKITSGTPLKITHNDIQRGRHYQLVIYQYGSISKVDKGVVSEKDGSISFPNLGVNLDNASYKFWILY